MGNPEFGKINRMGLRLIERMMNAVEPLPGQPEKVSLEEVFKETEIKKQEKVEPVDVYIISRSSQQ